MTNNPESRKTNIVVQELENEVLIYDLTINKAFCLNQTSALVYELADGTKTVSEISNLMSKKLKTLVSEDIVWLALDGLRKDNLLENADEVPNYFGGLTRREAVKKVGLASMVMLPIISSIAAPQAIAAQSICRIGVCIPAGTANFCAGCNGRTITISAYVAGSGCTTFITNNTFSL